MASSKLVLPVVLTASIAFSQPPPPPRPPAPTVSTHDGGTPAPAAPAAALIAKAMVQSVKPGLTARHVLFVKGFTHQMPRGGYRWTHQVNFRADGQQGGFVQIRLVGTADAGTPLMRGVPDDFKFQQSVEVAELKDRRGSFEVVVIDGADAELFRTTLKI